MVFYHTGGTPQWAKIKEHSTVIILIFENLQIYEQIQY